MREPRGCSHPTGGHRRARPARSPLATLLCLLPLAVPAMADTGPAASYVGSASCAACHPTESAAWRASDHQHAMAEATADSVRGDFADTEFSAHGVTSRFTRRDGGYQVRTDGPDGTLHDYPIRYTFGWWPLQQYLIAFPGGRLQCLGIAWDSRQRDAGGQRWFHLYPERQLGHTDPLHWTGREQNWNYQCAECHSTNLRKGYDLATDSFRTTWSEIDVGCEACHGPASRHVEQARGAPPRWDADKGLAVDLADRDGGVWTSDGASGLPRRSVPRQQQRQVQTCARCHSRRALLREGVPPGRPLGDSHRLALLDPALYHPDGQILGEVYVYGSFLQSRMYRHGVTCSDCHDPHGLRPKAPGNQVCARCHPADRYDSARHHHHAPGSTGAACTACHMPRRTYMTVDPRADHGLRIPRPDLTRKIGTPNACNDCHAEQTTAWAEQATRRWYGDATSQRPHFGEALQAGRQGAPDADRQLLALAADADEPGIARATALGLLSERPDPTRLLTLRRLLHDPDDLVRAAAVRTLAPADAATLRTLAWPLLDDPVLAVRLEAARVLAPLTASALSADARARLTQGLADYRQSQLANAERPESHLDLGLLATATGQPAAAEDAYRTALRLDPGFGPAYVNLADLYRAQGRDGEGETLLRQGLERLPDDASLHHALGLLQIRQGRLADAVGSLGEAARLAPENARYAYVHTLALQRMRDLEAARAQPGRPTP